MDFAESIERAMLMQDIAAANERIRELEAFQLACVRQLYEMLDVDGSDGEYRFKWAALELRNKLDQLTAERAVLERERLVSDRLEKALRKVTTHGYRSCREIDADWDNARATLSEASNLRANIAAIRAKQGGKR